MPRRRSRGEAAVDLLRLLVGAPEDRLRHLARDLRREPNAVGLGPGSQLLVEIRRSIQAETGGDGEEGTDVGSGDGLAIGLAEAYRPTRPPLVFPQVKRYI
jgi:hypothetical protein